MLIATATLAWGVNFPAHLVVVKGTEYFDGKQRRYVDFPITGQTLIDRDGGVCGGDRPGWLVGGGLQLGMWCPILSVISIWGTMFLGYNSPRITRFVSLCNVDRFCHWSVTLLFNRRNKKKNSREWCDLTCLRSQFSYEKKVLNVNGSHGIGADTPAYLLMGRGI